MENSFIIRQDIASSINAGQFRFFAKNNQIQHQGNKNNLLRNITLSVNEGQVNEEVVREFFREQLWYGKNKHNFYIELDSESLETFKYKESIDEYLTSRGLGQFNNIDTIHFPESITLSRFEYEVDQFDSSTISKIYVGFIEKNYIQKLGNGTAMFTPVNTYVCCEIDLVTNTLLLRIRSRSQLKNNQNVEDKAISVNSIAKQYMDLISSDFGLLYLDSGSEEIKNKMYKIEKELTNFIELQILPKVLEHINLISDFTKEIANKLELKSNQDPINLVERIVGLLERGLIVQNEGVVERYFEGKLGYVSKFDFRDDRGGRIQARTEQRRKPIQTSDIFFDTKETINEVQLLDSIWIIWFKELDTAIDEPLLEAEYSVEDNEVEIVEDTIEDQKKVARIDTRINAFKGFYKIEFKRYLLKEEYNHVLSLINSFT
ncbi:hypothetical protein [Paenibacillus agilis]|uniref:Uncharacterized protein n=1 Tax=Paenibacillus agilis TaxID=3020863 RepID=A0A559IY47_9BACL|nr:hypothetical protein [Paenibacillus agilis]TVX92555.1 hypothetical protein FPZ44_05485 [Paenibacillus agilis]